MDFCQAPLSFLPQCKDMDFKLFGDFKLDGGVTVSINVFLSLCDRDTDTVTDTVTCPELDKPIKRDGSKTAKITY